MKTLLKPVIITLLIGGGILLASPALAEDYIKNTMFNATDQEFFRKVHAQGLASCRIKEGPKAGKQKDFIANTMFNATDQEFFRKVHERGLVSCRIKKRPKAAGQKDFIANTMFNATDQEYFRKIQENARTGTEPEALYSRIKKDAAN